MPASSKSPDPRDQYVAFFDILGFRELVLGEPDLSRFCSIYRDVFVPLVSEIESRSIDFQIFSDSLFVCVRDRPEQQQLYDLVLFCRSLLTRAIEALLPVRGAISFGRVLWDERVVVGPAIIEAVEFAELQDWVGVILAPSVTRRMADPLSRDSTISPEPSEAVTYWSVPFKPHPNVVKAFAVVPSGVSTNSSAARLVKALRLIALRSGRPDAQRKCLETIRFVEAMSCGSLSETS